MNQDINLDEEMQQSVEEVIANAKFKGINPFLDAQVLKDKSYVIIPTTDLEFSQMWLNEYYKGFD